MWFDKTERKVLWNWFQAKLTSTWGSRDEIAGSRSELIAQSWLRSTARHYVAEASEKEEGTHLMWFECCSG